jgi:threonine dehydratase
MSAVLELGRRLPNGRRNNAAARQHERRAAARWTPNIEDAARVVYREFQATPQYRWGLSSQRLGTDCWIKHENHTPVGAFKLRGGLTYFEALQRRGELPAQVISATRGNHGQSIGWAARAHGVACTIVVPHGNSLEKNAAMRALGVTLIEHGDDFQESREFAMAWPPNAAPTWCPAFMPTCCAASAPTGGSSCSPCRSSTWSTCPSARARARARPLRPSWRWKRTLRIVGVVSAHATTYADSLAAGRVVEAPVTTQLADGMACRVADPAALEILLPHLDHIVQVSDAEVAQAMRHLYADTHNVAEGAGAASFAAAMQEREQLKGQVVGTTLCGGNVDTATVAKVLAQA